MRHDRRLARTLANFRAKFERTWRARLRRDAFFNGLLGGAASEGQCAAVIGPMIDYWNAKRVNGTTRLTPDEAQALALKEGRCVYRPCPSTSLLDLHMAYHETRRMSPAHTIDFLGREWPISPTMRKTVGVVLHPDVKFWAVEHQPDPASHVWPNILPATPSNRLPIEFGKLSAFELYN